MFWSERCKSAFISSLFAKLLNILLLLHINLIVESKLTKKNKHSKIIHPSFNITYLTYGQGQICRRNPSIFPNSLDVKIPPSLTISTASEIRQDIEPILQIAGAQIPSYRAMILRHVSIMMPLNTTVARRSNWHIPHRDSADIPNGI